MGTAAGQIIEDADFTAINLASGSRPTGRVIAAATVNLVNNTYTAIPMATEEYDSDGFHSTSVNTSRVTPTIPGWYRAHACVCFSGQTTYTFCETTIRPNGGTPIAPSQRIEARMAASAVSICLYTSALIECDGVSDYFEVVGRQLNTGASTFATALSSHLNSSLEWEYVRGL